MSHVDNWILILSCSEGQSHVTQLNTLLKKADPAREQYFRPVNDDDWGGSKFPEVDVYVMACNHFRYTSVLKCIDQVEWNDPEDSRVVCNTQSSGWIIASLDELPTKQ